MISGEWYATLQLSGWVTYALNATIVALYSFGAYAIGRRRGQVRSWRRREWLSATSFFVFCAITHFELAWIALDGGEYYVAPDGTANWWTIAALACKAISLAVLLWVLVVPPPPHDSQRKKWNWRGPRGRR